MSGQAVKKLTGKQLQTQRKVARDLALMATLKKGGVEHKQANERLLYLLIQSQEPIIKALIRKAKSGDVKAITEVLDRLYGKSKETIDLGGTVTFSLKALAMKREEEMKGQIIEAVVLDDGPHEQLPDKDMSA